MRWRALPRPERVSQLCHSDLRNASAVAYTISVVSQHLPAQLTSFVGRSSEIATCADSWRSTTGHADWRGRRRQNAVGGPGGPEMAGDLGADACSSTWRQ